MKDWQKRTALALAITLLVLVGYALTFQWGMSTFEQRPVTTLQAIQVVVETITTAGFGGQAPWSSNAMNAIVIAMNLTGVLLVFMALPLFVFPALRDALRGSLPASIERSDHVIICPFSSRTAAMVEELKSRGAEYIILEPDLERARSARALEHPVVHGNPELVADLARASLGSARAVVVDAPDDVSTSIILAIREVSTDVRVVTVVDDEALEQYHWLAGASDVLSPRRLIGQSLARQTPFLMTSGGATGLQIHEDLQIAELFVGKNSRYAGQQIAELIQGSDSGVTVIGAWTEQGFQSPIEDTWRIQGGTRLLVAGRQKDVARLTEELAGSHHTHGSRRVLIVGFGRSGKAAVRAFEGTAAELVVIDVVDQTGVDVVGDARDPEVYRKAGIDSAAAVILDLDDDTVATLAALIIRNANPETYILAGANADSNEKKLSRAGANYVQSLASVTALMVASTVFEDQAVLALEEDIEVVDVPAGDLAGRTLTQSEFRQEAGATVLAVVRGGEILSRIDFDAFVFAANDRLIVAGTRQVLRRYDDAHVRVESSR